MRGPGVKILGGEEDINTKKIQGKGEGFKDGLKEDDGKILLTEMIPLFIKKKIILQNCCQGRGEG